jgi:hypothetical protein
MTDELSIEPMRASDAGEILTVQRAAFVSEAIIYGDARMPPLVQTLDELKAELQANIRLYERCGYGITEEVDNADGTAQVFMRKRLRSELEEGNVAGEDDV